MRYASAVDDKLRELLSAAFRTVRARDANTEIAKARGEAALEGATPRRAGCRAFFGARRRVVPPARNGRVAYRPARPAAAPSAGARVGNFRYRQPFCASRRRSDSPLP